MEHGYERITTHEGRRAPQGKYRVMLNDHETRTLYLVSDHDRAEEAFVAAESIRGRNINGIVQGSSDFVLYPSFDGHQLHTSAELLTTYGRSFKEGGRPFTEAHIREIEKKQADRIPGWQPGDRLVVFWKDIADATGAKVYGYNLCP